MSVSDATAPAFDLHEYRAERNRKLERENEFLRAERSRLEGLLADALAVAVGGTVVDPLVLLDVLAERRGTALDRAAFIEHREPRADEAALHRVLHVLRETA